MAALANSPLVGKPEKCRLQADHGFVHFRWDYYMYLGVPRPCPVAERTASELGLYVEEFASPYHMNGGN
jgi:hypothetical protein